MGKRAKRMDWLTILAVAIWTISWAVILIGLLKAAAEGNATAFGFATGAVLLALFPVVSWLLSRRRKLRKPD